MEIQDMQKRIQRLKEKQEREQKQQEADARREESNAIKGDMLAEQAGLGHLVGEKNREEDEENIGVKPLPKEHHSDRREQVLKAKAKKYGKRHSKTAENTDFKRKERKSGAKK